jgi:hypothetical protein
MIMGAELSGIVLFVFAPFAFACFVYAGITNYEIRKLKKQLKELNLKFAEIQTKAGILN